MSVKKQVKSKSAPTVPKKEKIAVLQSGRKLLSGRDFLMMGVGAVLMGVIGLIPLGMQTAKNHRILSRQMFVLQQMVLQQRLNGKMPPHVVRPVIPSPQARHARFDEAQYRPYAEKGTFEITGDFCKHLPPHLACDEKAYVFANPVTDYSKEWFDFHWKGGRMIANPDQRAWHYHRKAVVRGNGYTLADLPAGEYYVGAQFCAKDKNPPAGDKQCTPVRFGGKVQVRGQKVIFDLPLVHQDKKGPAGCGCQHKP